MSNNERIIRMSLKIMIIIAFVDFKCLYFLFFGNIIQCIFFQSEFKNLVKLKKNNDMKNTPLIGD